MDRQRCRVLMLVVDSREKTTLPGGGVGGSLPWIDNAAGWWCWGQSTMDRQRCRVVVLVAVYHG